MEDMHINEVVRDALDVQLTEFTTDMKEMIEHVRNKIDEHIKEAKDRLRTPVQPQAPAQYTGNHVVRVGAGQPTGTRQSENSRQRGD